MFLLVNCCVAHLRMLHLYSQQLVDPPALLLMVAFDTGSFVTVAVKMFHFISSSQQLSFELDHDVIH